jgi:chaperonin GroEL
MALNRGIDNAVEVALGEIKRFSREVKGGMIAQVGTISANTSKQVGRIIAEAMKKVGKDGVITVEESKMMETTLEIVEGRHSHGFKDFNVTAFAQNFDGGA